MLKVGRYGVSDTRQSGGPEATFCVRWLVTASSTPEPVAESASHHAYSRFAGAAASGSACACTAVCGVRQATTAQSSANAANSHDHRLTCSRAANTGSTKNG